MRRYELINKLRVNKLIRGMNLNMN
jgi:hypothetical protein